MSASETEMREGGREGGRERREGGRGEEEGRKEGGKVTCTCIYMYMYICSAVHECTCSTAFEITCSFDDLQLRDASSSLTSSSCLFCF